MLMLATRAPDVISIHVNGIYALLKVWFLALGHFRNVQGKLISILQELFTKGTSYFQ